MYRRDADDLRIPQMLQLRAEGLSESEIGLRFGVRPQRINQLFKAAGVRGQKTPAMLKIHRRAAERKAEIERKISERISKREARRGLPRGILFDKKRKSTKRYRAKVGPKIIGYFETVDAAVAARAAAMESGHG